MTAGTTTAVSTDDIELVFVCEHCNICVDVSVVDFVALGQIVCGECGVPMDMSDAAKVVIV